MPVSAANRSELHQLKKNIERFSSSEYSTPHSHGKIDDVKSIEPPPYSPLTPRPLNMPAWVPDKNCMNIATIGNRNANTEKNKIEPPCSPLTPIPLTQFNAQMSDKECHFSVLSDGELIKSLLVLIRSTAQ